MARNLSPNTLETYLSAVQMFADFTAERGMPSQVASVRREHVEAFLAWMTESYKPASVRNRYTGLRQFFAWALEEGEITESPMRHIPPPAIPENPPPILSEAQVRSLLKVCSGSTFEDRRDTAIVSVLLDAGLRLAELVGMTLSDVDLETRTITVLGKGRRPRTVGLGVKALQAVDRYLRARRSHPNGRSEAFWLGLWSDDGLRGSTDAREARPSGGDRGLAPSRAAAPVRPRLARRRWRGRRPDAARGLALASDGAAVRRERGAGASDRRAPPTEPLGPAVKIPVRCGVFDGGEPLPPERKQRSAQAEAAFPMNGSSVPRNVLKAGNASRDEEGDVLSEQGAVPRRRVLGLHKKAFQKSRRSAP
jgi:integrase